MVRYNKQGLTRFVSLTLVIALLSIGLTTSKHLLSAGKSQLISLDRQMRRVGYHAERLNLRTAVSTDSDAPLGDLPRQIFTIPVPQNRVIFSSLFLPSPQSQGELSNFLRDQSPVLNL
jgi:hypothetical protein